MKVRTKNFEDLVKFVRNRDVSSKLVEVTRHPLLLAYQADDVIDAIRLLPADAADLKKRLFLLLCEFIQELISELEEFENHHNNLCDPCPPQYLIDNVVPGADKDPSKA